MSDRVTLFVSTNTMQTRAFRSHSYNPPPPTPLSQRSRRTLSLPAREKPLIPPMISENPEYFQTVHEQCLSEDQPCSREACDDVGWISPIIGFLISLFLFAWACLLSMSVNGREDS
ncbi:unnamed protein product [Pocillopora meandrina]|uniref:Uncharacterized protein n=1 Tax=Pocillopora meandrina TaxID=46732 RepID=A0AAU9XNE8_9CNID|nr:unnamed protein product [Pocillopora meandrina]